MIAAPRQKAPTVDIWEPGPGGALNIKTVPQHLVPRDRPVFRPSELSLVLARSYARYLCRAHGAASAEIIRHTKDPYLPASLLFEDSSPPAPEELVARFGAQKP